MRAQRILCFQEKGSPLLAQNEVQADIFSGSLAVFRNRKLAGECWRLMLQNAIFSNWRCAFEKNSNRFRSEFVVLAKFPPTPPFRLPHLSASGGEATLSDLPAGRQVRRFQVFLWRQIIM
jgi:hypothetical protein